MYWTKSGEPRLSSSEILVIYDQINSLKIQSYDIHKYIQNICKKEKTCTLVFNESALDSKVKGLSITIACEIPERNARAEVKSA